MKNQHPRQQTFKQQGFTLVEISIVIIILAIITSLVFPSYKKLVGKAKPIKQKAKNKPYPPQKEMCFCKI